LKTVVRGAMSKREYYTVVGKVTVIKLLRYVTSYFFK
jgi:hypothetical protein